MDVPLIAKTFIQDNRQYLEIWSNGEKRIVDPPFLPYFWTKKLMRFAVEPAIIEDKMVKPLSTLTPTKMHKYSFPTTAYINKVNKALDATSLNQEKLRKIFCENHTEFRERIIIDMPGWFKNFPQTNAVRPLFFDIETATKDGEDLEKVISICYAGPDREKKSSQDTDEKALIEWFFNAIIEIDPDLLVGYYMKDFDFSYLFDRAIILGINFHTIARTKEVVYYHENNKVKMEIGGRVLYDILDDVKADQTLYGIKNHKMKTVAKWMKFENVIEEDTSSTVDIPLDKLKAYNESDVDITMQLFDVYFMNNQTLAEMFGIPLNMVLEGSSSFIANVFQGQGIHAAGIVSDGMNQDRHPNIYFRQKEKGEANYQAAYVDIYKFGHIDKVWKVDYKGMYNAIEITVNASPDTTRIVGFEPFSEDGFRFEKEGHITKYYIPDNNIKKNVIIEVDNSFDGILKTELKKIRQIRAEIKQAMKSCSEEEKPRYESQQWALKVAANIPSGYNGQAICRWGDIAVSILTVGVGRLLIKDVIRYVEKKYGNNVLPEDTDVRDIPNSQFAVCIETDTDGIYVTEKIDIDDLNRYLAQRVELLLGTSNELELELEEFNEGYFIRMKNYVLYDTDGSLIIHGASLKSSRQPGCFDKALEVVAETVLKGKNSDIKGTINNILDIEKYDLHDLTLRTTLNKAPSQYAEGTFWGKLIKQATILGKHLKEGTQLEYIKTETAYQLSSTVNSIHEVDTAYYQGVLSKLIINFGLKKELEERNTQDMDEWY